MLAIARAGLVCVTWTLIDRCLWNADFGLTQVALNPAYQLPELDYCLKKVGVKAIVAPEKFRKQNHYEMLMNLVPNVNNNSINSLKNIIIASDKKLP